MNTEGRLRKQNSLLHSNKGESTKNEIGYSIQPNIWVCLGILILLLTACSTEYPQGCPSYDANFDLSGYESFPKDDTLRFQFPLEKYEPGSPKYKSSFIMKGRSSLDEPYEYHAAEDSYDPPGTPVYAMTDGKISFAGRMDGYGWLIIIDHPQVNLYSLYGHLSPSRWRLRSGTDVKKGDLIAYLGDDDENGGSKENPLAPHLHFGIRTGQRADYPKGGEWRWMAGWIRFCPQDLGWLQPSIIISSQEIPANGYIQPEMNFLTRWGLEIFVTIVYILGGGPTMIYAGKRKKSLFLLMGPGIVVTLAGITFIFNGMVTTYILVVVGLIMIIYGIYWNRNLLKEQSTN